MTAGVAVRWRCEQCGKVIAEKRGYETVIECRRCGHRNVA